MRQFFKLLIVPFLMVFLCAGSVLALPMPEADDIITMNYGTYHIGRGGEFAISGSNTSGEYWYTSFCLEINETFVPGSEYTVESVVDYATEGGTNYAQGAVDGEDYISTATKWLMNEYIFNYDSLYNTHNTTTGNENVFAGLVQNAIWYFENEITESNALAASIIGMGLTTESEATYMEWIKVVNIVDGNNNPRQSQLIATAPVPEPATLLLLGTGLVGLAGMSRKKFKK